MSQSSPSTAPFFIVGSERSGTTLLMAILGHHSRLAVPEVAWYYPRFRAYLHTYGDLTKPAHFRTLVSEMIFGLKTPFFGLPLNPATIVDELVAATQAPTFAEAYRVILERYAAAVNKPRWGEKTPHNLFYVREILADFPGAKIINLVRDGRDIAVEQLRSAFGPRNAYAAAVVWKRTHEVAAQLRRELPAATWLDVSYEKLAADPEPVLREVAAFLGEAYEPQILEFHRGEIAQRRGKTRDHKPLGQPVSSDYIGLYRRHLSLHDQEIFAGVAGGALRELGYAVEVEGAVPSVQDAALYLEHDSRIRAATLDAPEGHVVYESLNDWLIDQREERRRRGLWKETAVPAPTLSEVLDWDAEFISGQRAPRRWKEYFAVKRRYTATELVL
ncbi:Sulfotransferase family protein [Verrucomicrobium sp. GAS474]|uniref:sulfotransferase family protein n=1 Tax=Verrucomicrobium sp. GAS474 TaxID=1882831 RepID=UPI000879AE58|nr:sulfotransferase [Verrucomicrobium sp. GAS474]SDU12425.1 Sulfotransferase family protein [Verrucomicrobium sp. GAS474]